MLVQLTGSVSPGLSLPRALHRWLMAPARRQRAPEPRPAFDRADALTGAVALAGAVFVFAGVYPLGWALIGVCIGLAGAGRRRWTAARCAGLADLMARLAGPAQR